MNTATASEPFVFTPGALGAGAVPLGGGAGPVGSGDTDQLVNQTRREIAEIVREVAAAARSDRSTREFLTLLADRTLRAMAAEGVVVWHQVPEQGLQSVLRLGRTTDQSIPAESVGTHQRLLLEIATDGGPVVVPATPGATDAEVPANPTDLPVAVVPIEIDPSPGGEGYLLEVFLEPECGVATQRGYLRFVAQMADLAGEFLRADQLRHLRKERALAADVDQAVAAFHRLDNRKKLEAAIVDMAADVFGFDRVGLCVGRTPKLVAVSHVETIDDRSPAADQLRRASLTEVEDDRCTWFTETSRNNGEFTDELIVRAVVSRTEDRSIDRRLVCMQIADAAPIPSEYRGDLIRFMQHADLALQNAARLDAIPGGRMLASLAPAIQTHDARLWKTVAMAIVATIIGLCVALCPAPLIVSSPATIRPVNVQMVSAPRDAVVEEIHVQHGQQVTAGDQLVRLVDPALDEQVTTLLGRRAVLVQQRSQLSGELVDTASHQLDRLEQVQGEQRLVAEEIASIDNQLEVLRRAEASLLIHAETDGTIDAWQIEHRLGSRPLRRGDRVLQVIANDSQWVVEARVPQSRVCHVQDADELQTLKATVALDAKPHRTFEASLLQIGPAVAHDSVVSTAVLLRLSDYDARSIAANHGTQHHSGAPARVMFHCGTAPAAYLLLEDVIRSVRGSIALYGGGDAEETDPTAEEA